MRKILVQFALFYLRFFAKIQLFKIKPVIVGVGGASGKSSLANFISIVASQKFRIRETKGKNSETGIPLSILSIDVQNYNFFEWLTALILAPFKILFDWEMFDILIAEMGIDGPFEPKNMDYLLKIVKPSIGILTNISYEHSVYFEEVSKNKKEILELTSKQEALLLRSLSKGGTAILNTDDPEIRRIDGIKASKIKVSAKDFASDFFIEKIDTDLKSFKVSFLFKSKRYQISIKRPLSFHYAYSLVMAVAASCILGIEVKEAIKILQEKFSLPPGRLSIFEGKNDTTIIDSSYNNATLAPILDILDLLKKISGKRRKVAIIGDMRELGIISGSYHEEVANKLLETTDLVFLIGPLTQKFIAPVLRRKNHSFYGFNTFLEGKNVIKRNIEKGDIILVKGSQNTLFLERAVEMLLKNPKDRKRLARRGAFWDKIRSRTP